MKVLGLAPVALGGGLATTASAASQAEAAAGEVELLVHDVGMKDVLDLAKTYSLTWHNAHWWDAPTGHGSSTETNGQKYERVAGDLWLAFKVGIFHFNDENNTDKRPVDDLLAELFATKDVAGNQLSYTGKALVHNLAHFDEHKPLGGPRGKTYAHLTACAFRCGHKAAGIEKTDRVGIDAYNQAWKIVNMETIRVLEKAVGNLEPTAYGDIVLMNGGC